MIEDGRKCNLIESANSRRESEISSKAIRDSWPKCSADLSSSRPLSLLRSILKSNMRKICSKAINLLIRLAGVLSVEIPVLPGVQPCGRWSSPLFDSPVRSHLALLRLSPRGLTTVSTCYFLADFASVGMSARVLKAGPSRDYKLLSWRHFHCVGRLSPTWRLLRSSRFFNEPYFQDRCCSARGMVLVLQRCILYAEE